jgi:hypothetical protein
MFSHLYKLIKKQTKIRMVVDKTGNFGNQAATLNLINKLHEMGFHGNIEVIYFKECKDKILNLFDLSFIEEDTFKMGNLHFVELQDFIKNRSSYNTIALGMTGAIDSLPNEWDSHIAEENFADFFRVKGFIRFSSFYNIWELCDTEIFLLNTPKPFVRSGSCQEMLNTPISTLDEAKNYLLETATGKKLLEENPGLTTLISHIETASSHFFPIYGWTLRDIPSNLLNMILGARYAQLHGTLESRKPLIIGAFFDINQKIEIDNIKIPHSQLLSNMIFNPSWGIFDNFEGVYQIKNTIKTLRLSENFKMGFMSSNESILAINNLKQDDILLLSIPKLPKIVFDGLYTYNGLNVFPQVREGASAFISLMTVTGRPHIHCASHHEWEIDTSLADPKLKKYLTYFNNIICKGSNFNFKNFEIWHKNPIDKVIGTFILAAQNPLSPLSQYFSFLKSEAIKPANDRILNDLDLTVGFLSQKSDEAIPPLKAENDGMFSYQLAVFDPKDSYYSSQELSIYSAISSISSVSNDSIPLLTIGFFALQCFSYFRSNKNKTSTLSVSEKEQLDAYLAELTILSTQHEVRKDMYAYTLNCEKYENTMNVIQQTEKYIKNMLHSGKKTQEQYHKVQKNMEYINTYLSNRSFVSPHRTYSTYSSLT